MLRSLYSGISGMKNFQTKLDVIGNNIANVNTFGFKKGRTTFSDQISQTMAGTTAPADAETGRGGRNAKQVGLGSTIASIDTIATQGSSQNTGRGLDLTIEGNGYFIVNDGNKNYYTRAGNFYLDKNGDIVNSDGLFLGDKDAVVPTTLTTIDTDTGEVTIEQIENPRGNGKINIPTTAQSLSIGTNGEISVVEADGQIFAFDEGGRNFQIAVFPNPEGLTKMGANLYQESSNSGSPVDPEAEEGKQYSNPETAGAGSIKSGFLEMSNVDLSEEFTEMIVAQRAFQSNTKIITTSDEILQELVNLKR